MRAVRTCPAELAIVVAVVAIGAENLCAHGPALGDPIEIQHAGQQAGLRERAVADVRDGMAGGGGDGELRNQIEGIACRNRAHREVSIDGHDLLAGTGGVAAQAILILINGGGKRADTVGGADAGDVFLRDADEGRRREDANLLGAVRVVAIDASGMAVVVEQVCFCRVVRVGGCWKRMSDLGGGVLGKDVGIRGHG